MPGDKEGVAIAEMEFQKGVAWFGKTGLDASEKTEAHMSEGKTFTIAGKALVCSHCSGRSFGHQRVKIDQQALGGWIHLEGIYGKKADLFTCTTCGRLEWFVSAVPEDETEDW